MRPNHTTNKQSTITRFALGRTFITPGAEEALQIAGQTAIEFLRRHMSGDWGELSDEDVKENEFSLKFVPINQTIRPMLERLPRTSEYVFPSPKTEGRLKFRFDKAKREAGIRDFRFHDLRHTAATRMADGGADAFALAEIFGWSYVRMALRYTHATDDSKRRAVENLVKPIGPSDESVTNEKSRVAALP